MDFILGCNYWASNAGTEMWNQWSEEAVRDDFEILSSHGVEYLRVFPNWRDFQPVIPLYGCRGRSKGFLLDGDKTVANPYFLDEEMLDKFDRFCDLAEEYGLKFIVGLITGWMSGRLFVPPVLYGKNLFSDATALMLEQRFIKGFVNRFKHRKCIYAWDLGNECDCLSETESRERADTWAMMISNAIRANDPTRPIISGMHGLDIGKMWNMFDQSESVDMFTTHPYPYWVAHCSEAKVTSVQTLMHATCQTKYYAELGNRPCLVEEIGTMGPMLCGDKEAGDFLKVNLFSNWANGATGVMWWCANEQ
ncbi:MAG: cellulase family glycosylhydrolase, partial [Lachnospiraceae bacterium]|nr:cellulase family glycosylhydrolase [Lachnospiraceae bacterium]